MKSIKSSHHINVKHRQTYKLIILLILVGTAFSQSFAQYEIKKYTINSGQATLSGGGFQIQSSIGQVDANQPLNGGNFSLSSGFWQEDNDLIFKNNLEGTGE